LKSYQPTMTARSRCGHDGATPRSSWRIFHERHAVVIAVE
jgi:hypothetical protein